VKSGASARAHMKADALRNLPIVTVSIIEWAHRAAPEHLSNVQTAKVYDAGVQNRMAPQTICCRDPLRSLLFRRCRRHRLFAVWRDQFQARDRPYDQCSRMRGPEKGHDIWSAMIDFRHFCYREQLDEPKAAESTKFSRSPLAQVGVCDTGR
jgi:hypothetical protein